MDVAADKLELDEIQGNILAGFKNEFITFLFLTLPGEGSNARAWLADVIADVATTPEVKNFNDLYRLSSRAGADPLPTASWMNLALTHKGLQALGVAEADLDQLPEEFQEGMRARKEIIGDTGDDDASGMARRSRLGRDRRADDRRGRRPRRSEHQGCRLRRARGARGANCVFRRGRQEARTHEGVRAFRLQGRDLTARRRRLHGRSEARSGAHQGG